MYRKYSASFSSDTDDGTPAKRFKGDFTHITNENYATYTEGSNSSGSDNDSSHGEESHSVQNNEAYSMPSGSASSDDDQAVATTSTYSKETPQYSDHALRMMKRMGYQENKGLGKAEQGRLEPVEASTQKGRRGLGLKLDGLDTAALKWDPSIEMDLQIPEKVTFLSHPEQLEDDLSKYDGDLLWSWLKVGDKKLTIDDETNFCDPEVIEGVLSSKSLFDKLGATDMMKARTRANPFETIKHNVFQNRAAVKMANIDQMFDFMFTNPIDMRGQPMIRDDDLLYFADVCAGPGGFSEYVLYRKGWTAKGFGFTLKAENDFKLQEFYAGTPETFDTYYGVHQDGNVFDPENCASLKDYVLGQTFQVGVHFMMADGGFSVEGQENIQEILSKQLYLCQCLVALSLVRVDGHFVVKLFDLFTPFSVGLIYLMYKCFHSISICKPNTSRPANSERYLVCKWKKSNTGVIENHLFKVNEYLFDKTRSNDILELVPMEILMGDKLFFNYIYDSNNTLGIRQVDALRKIAAFCANTDLIDARQVEVKKKCLQLWQLEDKMRKAPPKVANDYYLSELLGTWNDGEERQFLDSEAKNLTYSELNRLLPSVHDWYIVPLECRQNPMQQLRTFFMGRGGRNVLAYNPSNRSWQQVNKIWLELSPKTLVYGEIVKEYIGEYRKQRSISAFHIIDGIYIGGTDIRKLNLTERIKMCTKFARSLNKPLRTITGSDNTSRMTVPVRCKRPYALTEYSKFIDSLRRFKLKSGVEKYGIRLPNECNDPEDRYYIPEGLMLLNSTNEAFMKCFSRTSQEYYYFDKRSRESVIPSPEIIKLATASFRNTFNNRLVWQWREDQSNLQTHQGRYEDGSGNELFLEHIETLVHKTLIAMQK